MTIASNHTTYYTNLGNVQDVCTDPRTHKPGLFWANWCISSPKHKGKCPKLWFQITVIQKDVYSYLDRTMLLEKVRDETGYAGKARILMLEKAEF